MNKLDGLHSTQEIGDWYDKKYFEMGGTWCTPPEDCKKHIDRIISSGANTDHSFLDLGCGGGHFLAEVQKLFKFCFGIEVSINGLNEAKLRAKRANFRIMDIEDMHFLDQSFGVITSIGTAEHLINIPKGISEIFRVLRPGGIFYLYAPNLEWEHMDQPQETRMERHEWEKILTDAGFKCEYFEKDGNNNIYIAKKI